MRFSSGHDVSPTPSTAAGRLLRVRLISEHRFSSRQSIGFSKNVIGCPNAIECCSLRPKGWDQGKAIRLLSQTLHVSSSTPRPELSRCRGSPRIQETTRASRPLFASLFMPARRAGRELPRPKRAFRSTHFPSVSVRLETIGRFCRPNAHSQSLHVEIQAVKPVVALSIGVLWRSPRIYS